MNCSEVVKILELILDSEATAAQKEKFFKHVDKCAPCFGHYETDKLFKEFIQKMNTKECCPEELLQQLRNQIKGLSA